MDARLSAVHQQYITQELARVKSLLVQHDQEIAALALVIIGLCAYSAYSQYQIRRLEDGQPKGPSGRNSKVASTED
jgi:hypothetical protein